MKTERNIYKAITILSMVTMPAAAAINFGDAAFDALNGRTHFILAIIAGVFTGVGFETIGIVAGHRAVNFYSKQDQRWVIAALSLLAYIVIGVWEMHSIPFARFVPILSGLVYVLAGLQSEAETEAAKDDSQAAWERERAERQDEFEKELKLRELEANTAVKLARVEAKTKAPAKSSQKVSQVSQNESAEPVKHYECVCGRVFEGSRSYNAHRRHCETPANEPVRIYANGAKLNGVAKVE